VFLLNPKSVLREDVTMPLVKDIIPVVLAAGDSTRMGYPKALLPLKTDNFITHILKTLDKTGFGRPIVVLGKYAPVIQAQVALEKVDVFINPDPSRGQLSSLQLALNALSTDCVATLVWPVDQPLISEKLVLDLADLFLRSNARIASPIYGSKRGHPVIFRRDLFPESMAAPLNEGPKKIVKRYRNETVELITKEEGTVFDIDTPEDYENALGNSLDSVCDRSIV
jgi:molybdenum cofactor cytidylyltransferase